jgi:hypothetical protein
VPRSKHAWIAGALVLGALAGAPRADAAARNIAQAPAPATGAETTTVVAGIDTVGMSGTAPWRVGYQHSFGSPQTSVAVTATMKGAHRAASGTVRLPPDWTVDHADALKFSIPLTPSKVTGRIFTLPRPLNTLSTGNSGGDGFTPTIVGERAYVLHHHENGNTLQCVDLATGSVCAGHPSSAYNGKTSDVPGRAAVVGTRLYYRRSNSSGFGLFCFDTTTTAACGTQPFFVARIAQEKKDRGSEPVAVNGKVYAVVDDHQLYCWDPATASTCTGYPKKTALADKVAAPTATGNDRGLMDIAVDGTRIYLSYADDYALPDKKSSPTGYLHCFDTATGSSCWTSYVTWALSSDDGFGFALFFRKNAQAVRTGVCLGSYLARRCTDLGGNNQTTTDTQDGIWGAGHNDKLATDEAEGPTRTFHGSEKPSRGVTCWDWTTDAPCAAGTFSSGRWYAATTAKVYGVNGDPDGRCGWGATHDKILFSFSLTSAAAGCGASDASLAVKPAAFYCDGKNHVTTWDKARVLDTNLAAGGDFTSLRATVVRTSDNTKVKGPVELVGTDGTVGLTGITGSELRVDLTFTPRGSSPWNDAVAPKVELLFDGDPVQMCWDSNASGTCTMDPRRIETVATATKTGALDSDSVAVALDPTCTGTVTGTVRISADPTASTDDPPGANVPIEILTGTTVKATATTGPDGTYRVDIAPAGPYTVRVRLEGPIAGYLPIGEADGVDDGRLGVTVRGGSSVTADFTLLDPPSTLSIGAA